MSDQEEEYKDMNEGSSEEGLTTDSEEEDDDLGLTENQKRLLYLISLYSHPAESGGEKERWVRKQALLVLVYEGIVEQVLDYDYAPSSEIVESRRMYFNISQEGKSDIDFLQEEELVNGLKISSKDHLPVTMYQISIKGLDAVRKVPRYDREAVHRISFSPNRSLMQVRWDGEEYWLVAVNKDGDEEDYRKKSSVLQIEAVSYVSSAYIPACLRQGGRPTLSNAHRATECAENAGTIRDDLDEVITLNSVSIIVSEFIPYGPNLITDLNHSIGSVERVQAGFFTAAVQDDNVSSEFQMDPGLTAIQILDYSMTGHINVEADIRLPEPEGIVQVETFGISIQSSGTLFYGLQLEAVMDRVKDAISLDHLSRLLADVHTDSSEVIDALLSPQQRDILDLIYRGDAPNRNKTNLIIANEITPHLTADEYLDRGEYENELKQVIGDTRAAFDITQYDTLIFGDHGLLLAGPNSRTYEPLLCSYLQLSSMDLFVRNFFSRLAVILDFIRDTQALLVEARHNPLLLREARARVPEVAREVTTMEKVLTFLEESLVGLEVPPPPSIQAGRALYDRLATPQLQSEMARRVTDLTKFLAEISKELAVLEKECDYTAKEVDRDYTRDVAYKTREMLLAQRRLERQTNVLEIIQFLLAGSLGFDVLDRVTGEWSVVTSSWFQSFYDSILLGAPLLWFLVSLIFFAVIAIGVAIIYRKRERKWNQGIVRLRLELRHRMSVPRFEEFLNVKRLQGMEWEVNTTGDNIIASWTERDKLAWGGVSPRIELEYSAHRGEIRYVSAEYRRNAGKGRIAFNAQELRERIVDELKKNRVLRRDPEAPKLVMGPLDMMGEDPTMIEEDLEKQSRKQVSRYVAALRCAYQKRGP